MARPTNEVKKHFIGVRLTDSEYEALGENKSEAIRDLINSVKQNGFVKQNGGNVKQNSEGFVKQNDSFVKQNDESIDVSLKSIESMVRYTGGTLEEFLDDLDFKLTMEILPLKDGVIDVEQLNDEVKKELSNLKSLCEEKGVSLVDAIRKTERIVQGIRQ